MGIGRSVLKFKTLHLCFDSCILFLVLACYYLLRANHFSSLKIFIPYALIIMLIWLFTIYACGGYDYGRVFRFSHNFRMIFFSCLIATMISQFFALIYPVSYYALGFHYTTIVFILIFYLLRLCITRLLAERMPQKRLLIYGAGWAGKEILDCIGEYPYMKYKPVVFIDDDQNLHNTLIEELPVIGGCEKIYTAISEFEIDTVVLAITRRRTEEVMSAKSWLQEQDIEVVEMPALYECLTERVPVLHVNNKWHDFYVSMKNRQPYLPFRLYNLCLAILFLIVFLPLLPFIILAIKISSKGPILYSQTRVGRKEKLFTLYKFRSMSIDAEKDGVQWAQEKDPRLTPIGGFLRKTRIDEIPQLINVLRGDMNLVGPRPERPEFVAELNKKIPFYRARHQVPPGLTGWAQVRMGYASSVEDSLKKLQYDLYYIKHRGIFLDLLILSKTILVVLARRGT
jgi:exopolysaccharide biosynthesis polyprenyl glycosylphosphotransferase